MNNSQTILLTEMGLGPVWKLRQNVQSTAALGQASLPHQPDAKSPMSEAQTDLKVAPAGCPVCGFFSAHGAPHLGTQVTRPDYLFVVQSPDADQTGQGALLEGAAAVLLDNMLRALDVQRGGKAALVKLVQSGRTIAQSSEQLGGPDTLSLCQACLTQQIESMQPSMLIALGQNAAVSLLGMDAPQDFASLQGQLHEYHGRPLLLTYHPAYLLKRPADKSRAWSDLCLALQTLARV